MPSEHLAEATWMLQPGSQAPQPFPGSPGNVRSQVLHVKAPDVKATGSAICRRSEAFLLGRPSLARVFSAIVMELDSLSSRYRKIKS